jgi:hypothetical protein
MSHREQDISWHAWVSFLVREVPDNLGLNVPWFLKPYASIRARAAGTASARVRPANTLRWNTIGVDGAFAMGISRSVC